MCFFIAGDVLDDDYSTQHKHKLETKINYFCNNSNKFSPSYIVQFIKHNF